MNDQNEIVYVLSNPAMQGLVKIGKTTQSDIANRMRQLYTTGVPLPFEITGLDYSVQPAPHWTYEGRTLTDIYNDTYAQRDD